MRKQPAKLKDAKRPLVLTGIGAYDRAHRFLFVLYAAAISSIAARH